MNFLVTWLHFEAVAKLWPSGESERLAANVYSHLRSHYDTFGLRAVVIPHDIQVKRTIGFDLVGLTEVAHGVLLREQLDVAAGIRASDLLQHVVTHARVQADALPIHYRIGPAPSCRSCSHRMWLIWPSYFCGNCGEILTVEGE